MLGDARDERYLMYLLKCQSEMAGGVGVGGGTIYVRCWVKKN